MEKKELESAYGRFAGLIEKDIYEDPELTFPEICKIAGAPVKELDRHIRKELGVSGRELILGLRKKCFKKTGLSIVNMFLNY